jgi:uncharacterized membrane protein
MADRAVVAVFDTQNQAYDAAADLQRLSDRGTVTVKRGAIATKDEKGNLNIADSRGVGMPWGMLGGGVIGGLLGLLLGPAAVPAGAAAGAAAAAAATGAAIGTSSGLVLGGAADLVGLGLDDDFVSTVGRQMNPGKSALIVEVNEGSTEPIDKAVSRHHGKVYRSELQ